jgi:hypothetical protein
MQLLRAEGLISIPEQEELDVRYGFAREYFLGFSGRPCGSLRGTHGL